MFDSIQKLAQDSDFDFRTIANPADPLRDRFPEWVPYYKMKWAIARQLQPASILEVGVRFGYSAAAFLFGAPKAKYLGIDLDTDNFGGVKGAIEWARKITALFQTDFLVADSQKMARFPGETYDLIHVDGQQDGDGTYHDMELAIRQGRYVLADGYFWSRQNYQALTEFLYQNRERIEFYGVVPGYAGELLLKIAEPELRVVQPNLRKQDSRALQHTYTAGYYLNDCGGYVEFRRHKGKYLEDSRLRAVANIARLKKTGRVLDLGCGRGELSYYFSAQGFEVTAIDYSEDAIALARQCFEDDPALKTRVQLLCGDVCTAPLEGQYDLVVAADLIEHLAPEELEKLYARVSRHLKPDGSFILHTFPNAWFYRYEYARKRRIAASVGAYLPPQPRTRYEMLMHINEQSPATMRRALRRHFSHALLWFGGPEDPGGSLLRHFNRGQLRAAPDLFAVASHALVMSQRIADLLQTQPLKHVGPRALDLAVVKAPCDVNTSEHFVVEVELKNASAYSLSSYPPNPVHISYHWLEPGGKIAIHEGERTPLWPVLEPGERRRYAAKVQPPPAPGNYRLRMTLVQENVRWFDSPPFQLSGEHSLIIHGPHRL